jgi:hypothetical protein
VSHAVTPEEGGAVAVGCQAQKREDAGALGAQTRKPAVVEQAVLEPAERARGAANELGVRGPRTAHEPLRRVARTRLRFVVRRASRSLASLRR